MYRGIATALITLCFLVAPLASASAEGSIQVPRIVPYASEASVAENVKSECTTLGEKFGSFLEQYATKNGVATTIVETVDPNAPGRVLELQITGAISSGNAFTGHRKQVSAVAELFEDGKSLGRKEFTRDSGGGFMGGYKGSCAVLGRCVKALGGDVAKWLKSLQ